VTAAINNILLYTVKTYQLLSKHAGFLTRVTANAKVALLKKIEKQLCDDFKIYVCEIFTQNGGTSCARGPGRDPAASILQYQDSQRAVKKCV
jgi:hypothetical protein